MQKTLAIRFNAERRRIHATGMRCPTKFSAKALLIDIDGVLYTADTPVPGAVEAVAVLQERDIPHRYISNSTRRSRTMVAERLRLMGFPIREDEILTPAVAAARYLVTQKKMRGIFVTTNEVIQDFTAAGVIPAADRIDAVIVGDAGSSLSYTLLNAAFRAIMEGAEILALEKDRYWMDTKGLSLAAGPFVAALEYATGKEALVIGKPSPVFFQLALSDMGIRAGETVMIGDDIKTDIQGAMQCGMSGILVRTGKFREDALGQSGVHPTCILDAFPAVLDLFADRPPRS
ncbi:MAG: TIGR01458 family HAD-type hydrolase [Methanoregulaceae archaeon]|nr:TIGR01458 family HAD-type hydrolase [Methanoregulaceae archaeon]